MLQNAFIQLTAKYTTDNALAERCWAEIEKAYSQQDRRFHTLSHLEQLAKELHPLQASVSDWDSLQFALYFHDIAYDVIQYVLENDNEERSAAIARQSLTSLHFPEEKLLLVEQHILATKTHNATSNGDTNLFIDADLSILGKPWEIYQQYMKDIRQEYIVYPDPIYNAGRVKVLKHFLQMEKVYKTDHFYGLYEESARDNMKRELEILYFS